MPQNTEGLKSGILSANIVLADTGPAAGYSGVSPMLWFSTTVVATFELQHRNAANNANIWAHRFPMSATQPVCTPTPSGQIVLDTDERLRVMLVSSIIGDCQATILT